MMSSSYFSIKSVADINVGDVLDFDDFDEGFIRVIKVERIGPKYYIIHYKPALFSTRITLKHDEEVKVISCEK